MEVSTDRLEVLYHALSERKGEIGIYQKFGSLKELVIDLKQYALGLVFDLEASRREQKQIIEECREAGIPVNLNNPRGLRKQRISPKVMKDLRDFLPGGIDALVDVLEVYASVKGKSSISQYVEIVGKKNGKVKTVEDFLDFLTICTRYIRFDISATKEENQYLQRQLRGY